MRTQSRSFRRWHLVGGAAAVFVALTSLQILAAPITTTPTTSTMTSRDASDDAREGTVVVRESPAPASIVAPVEPSLPPSSDGATRTLLGAPPAQIARVEFPTSIEAIAAARGIVVTEAMRQQAFDLYAKVVPDAVARDTNASGRAAAEAFIAAGPAGVQADDPCVKVGAGQRAGLLDAFVRTQGELPEATADYQFACALVTDPRNPIDITKVFPKHRRIDLEPFALKTFTAFFGRLPSKAKDGTALATAFVDKDWWAVKYMTYFPILTSSFRDLDAERTCIKEFTSDAVTLYKDGVKTTKPAGEAPDDVWEWSFVRACAYSGAPFLDQFAKR